MSLDQIGQKLKSARDITGLSLAQIQEKTKIPYNHLASIDAGNFDDLPEPVYVAGFIRRYAECIGLDAQELVDTYRSELDAVSERPEKRGLIFKGQKNNGNNMPPQANYYNRPRIERAAPNLFKLVPFYALWIILILVLIVYLVNRQGEIEQSQQDSSLLTLKQSTSSIVAPKAISTTLPEGASVHSENTTDSQSAPVQELAHDTYQVTLKAKNHVWVEVKAASNGEALFNGFLEAGDTHNFSDKEGLRIRAGNGGNVIVTVAGKTADLGPPGKIAEKIFSNNKISQTTQEQNKENSSETIPSKTSSSTITATGQNTNILKHTSNEIGIAKKPVTALVKRTVVEHLPSIRGRLSEESAKEHISLPEAVSPGSEPNNQNAANKSIDVPYRYSE